MGSIEVPVAVAVQQKSTGIVELFSTETCPVDENGLAHNLITGTEYIVLDSTELSAYSDGNFQFGPDVEHEPGRFSLIFPGLDVLKKSLTAFKQSK